jgi:hypothetical protein
MSTAEQPSPRYGRPGRRAERLAAIATRLEVELPPFEGPLVAFGAEGPQDADASVYLGGDLHAVHPEARVARAGGEVDRSLDAARIAITNFEHPALETSAGEGLWCLPLAGPIIDTAPYLWITDGEGRTRTWILLPSPRLMIGIGHYWLPAVAPLPTVPVPRRGGRRHHGGEVR